MTTFCTTRRGALAAALLLAAGAFACKPAEAPPSTAAATPAPGAGTESALLAQADQAAAAITADVLRAPIAEIGSDAYEGREPGSAGDAKAREYLVQQMQQLGLQPGAADGTWQQPFELVGIDATAPSTWKFAGPGGKSASFKWYDEYIAAAGTQDPQSTIDDAEVVFVGYGIQAPEYQWDDFKGQDLEGKVLLMLNNDPDWDDSLFAGKRRLYYGRWTYKYESAARQGAAGAIIIHTDDSAGYPFQVVQTSWTGEQFELPRESEPRIQVRGWLDRGRLAPAGRTSAARSSTSWSRRRSRATSGRCRWACARRCRWRTRCAARRPPTCWASIPGRDEKLGQQVVVFTAHHDHLGVGEPDETGDRIYNGALDNASGCSELLAIARAFKALPEAPRRTIMIAFVAAEEQGLLGSKYLAEHPPVPAGRIAADINFDSANIWGKTKDVTYIGIEKSSLGEVVRRFAGEQGREVKGDQFPDRGFYYRSDQFSFAKVGVPAIYLEPGTDFEGRPPGWGKEQMEKHENESYHQPSDELTPDWNFDGMVAGRPARLRGRPVDRRAGRDARLDTGRRVRGGAEEGDRRGGGRGACRLTGRERRQLTRFLGLDSAGRRSAARLRRLRRLRRLPPGLELDADGHLVAEHRAALVEGAVPGDAVVLAVDGEGGGEAGLLAAAVGHGAEQLDGHGDALGDAVDGEVTGERHLGRRLALHRDALEGERRVLGDVEEVGRTQVLVALGRVGVDARRLHRDLDARLLRSRRVVGDGAREVAEAPVDAAHQVADAEAHRAVVAVDGEGARAARRGGRGRGRCGSGRALGARRHRQERDQQCRGSDGESMEAV